MSIDSENLPYLDAVETMVRILNHLCNWVDTGSGDAGCYKHYYFPLLIHNNDLDNFVKRKC